MSKYGMLMRPCAMNEVDYKKIWQSSEFWTDKNFLEEYSKHRIAMQHVAECAKIYIMENWQKVKDWSDLNVVIKCRQGKFEFFNFKPRSRGKIADEDQSEEKISDSGMRRPRKACTALFDEIMDRAEESDKEKHNPIQVINEFVLDPTDGDFSVTINDQELWMINEEAIIEIANWIEEQLNQPEGLNQ